MKRFNLRDSVVVTGRTQHKQLFGAHGFEPGTVGTIKAVYKQGTVHEYYHVQEDATGEYWFVMGADLEHNGPGPKQNGHRAFMSERIGRFAESIDTYMVENGEFYAALRF